MLKRAAFVLVALAVLGLGLLPSSALAQTPPPETSSLLVKLVPGLTVDEQAAVVARNGGTETGAIPALRLHVVEVLTVELADTIARYEADPQVQHVEENRVRRSEMLSNDTLAVDQWALPQIGWDLVFGVVAPTGTAKVAILDTGIDASHPDLAGRVVAGTSILDGSDGRMDSHGHGTQVAGIVAANTDNAAGVAGVAFAGVQLVPVTVLDANGEGRDSDVIAGVLWAADHGADVILMAFSNPGFSPNLQEAIDYAWSRGAVVVAAIGNDGVGTPTFPAGDRGVIGVSGTDPSDALLGFSNYGQAAFLAAPGDNIVTTGLGGGYVAVGGTSSSAAIVAGVAGFLKAVDPTLTNGMIVGRMARTADPAGTQEQTGNGRVNMARALEDTGTDELQPAGADPVGDGGPFVGPYRVAGNARISGTVKDNANQAISGATVTCTNGCNAAASTTTNASGAYPPSGNFNVPFDGNPPPNVSLTLTASAVGFASSSQTILVTTNGQQFTLNFILSPACTGPSITTQPSGATKTVGESVTFSVVASGTTPLSYQWRKGGVDITGATARSYTIASVTTGDAGNYDVVVTNACGSATSDPGGQTVTQRATTTSVSSNKTPSSTFGESVIFTATVAGTGAGSGDPGSDGVVTFKADGSAISSCSNVAVNGSGVATCSTSALTVAGSPHAITAEYRSGANFADSDGTLTGGQTVNKRATSTAVSSSQNPSTFGESVTFTATVTGTGSGSGDPNSDGTVTFKADAIAIASCSNVAVNGSHQATCSTSALTVAGSPHAITAEYRNGANFADSNGTLTGGQTVNKRATSTAVSSSQNPSTLGQSVTFTATVTGTGAGSGDPGSDGQVTFKADGGAICTDVALSGNQATCATAGLSVGNHVITAEYHAGANFADSTGTLAGGQAVHFNFNGFFQPVENRQLNGAKAGSAIPMKFSLGGNQGLGILMAGYPKSIRIACSSGETINDIDLTETVTAGSSSLQYDPGSDQYIYVWKTDKSWANTCRRFQLGLIDGSDIYADFQFKK